LSQGTRKIDRSGAFPHSTFLVSNGNNVHFKKSDRKLTWGDTKRKDKGSFWE
jgi:hypothetical protein